MELVEDGVYLPAMIKRFWIVEGLIFVKVSAKKKNQIY